MTPTMVRRPSQPTQSDPSAGRPSAVRDAGRTHSDAPRIAVIEWSVPAPSVLEVPEVDEVVAEDRPWVVIVWNDPINLMSYVTFVLQKLFGYSLEKATALMLDVHHKGRAVVANGTREQAEMHVFRLHEHGLWATMEHDE